MLGFTYSAYTDRYWWYEVVYLLRKLLLNGVVMFLATATNQMIFSLLVCFAAVCLQLVRPQGQLCDAHLHVVQIVDPYKQHSDNVTQAVLVIQLFLTMLLGLIVLIQTADTTITAAAQAYILDVWYFGFSRVQFTNASVRSLAGRSW